ncbi:DUF2849 domain-containing protein [uncultured Devosia sp.]|uniref:DUF2849 domain-containing protein n=1 Tax=uncultured Devosia sp. TaxID=211434 RepID=UPI0035CB930A
MDILVGNELTSGAAVYLDNHGNWVESLQAARLFGKDDAVARDAAIAATKSTGRIVGVEIEDVDDLGGHVVPKRLRERIRSVGPTTTAWNGEAFDRQHLDEDGHVSI